MTRAQPRDRLVEAAFALFAERGYEHTTVEEIAERAGLSRATYFRHFRSKEDVIFPDHDHLLGQVQDRLSHSSQQTALSAVSDAVRLVLLNYASEGDRARTRYRLTSSVPALRDREIASVARYQRLFREFIAEWLGTALDGPLQAELMAASVVAAHNHVLRRWLRGECSDPAREVDVAMQRVMTLFSPARNEQQGQTASQEGRVEDGSIVVAFRSDHPLEQLIPHLEKAIRLS